MLVDPETGKAWKRFYPPDYSETNPDEDLIEAEDRVHLRRMIAKVLPRPAALEA
jgi:hypothetical protein